MSLRIDLPDDLVRELEQEVARQELSLAEVIREALHMWRTSPRAQRQTEQRSSASCKRRGFSVSSQSPSRPKYSPSRLKNWSAWVTEQPRKVLCQNSLLESAVVRCDGALFF